MRLHRVIIIALMAVLFSVLAACSSGSKGYIRTDDELLNDQIVISVFWPPSKGFATQQQYEYLKEANIDLLEWNNDPIFTDPDTLKQTLELCEKNGIKITVCDESFGDVTVKTDDELRAIVEKYKDYSCVVGFFLRDEPLNANAYGRVTRVISEAMPGAICQMNMLPINALPDYQGHAEDWINAAGPENLRYLSFDQYPFGLQEGSVPQMFVNMNAVRETGLKYGVDTALYIQSVGSIGHFRKPTASETRYHVSAALAYGYKNLKYFTWITPVERITEDFTNAIIKPDGTPDDIYKDIVDINAKVKKVSNILGNLDAVQIYHSGRIDADTKMLPDDWYVKAENENDFLVSLMVNRGTGRDYLMFVNKNFSESAEISVKLSGIDFLEDVTEGADTAAEADTKGGRLSMTIEAGGFRLYRLPESARLQGEPVYDESANLAKNKPIYSSYSVGENGYYTCKANDGVRIETDDIKGWKLEGHNAGSADGSGWITVDLLRETDINRVDLYPNGEYGTERFARYFPLGFRIECSSDNKNWTAVYETEDYTVPESGAAQISFDTVKARYVRLYVTKYRISAQIAVITEFEIYNDDGSIPAARQPVNDAAKYASMENIAYRKSVSSSSTYEADGWGRRNLTDGKDGGWTTQPGLHMYDPTEPEWCMIDLKEAAEFNTVLLYPRQDNTGQYFPASCCIQISDDKQNWTDIAVLNDDGSLVTMPRIVKTDSVTARYVRILALEMTMPDFSRDGYLMQFSEVEIYNDK